MIKPSILFVLFIIAVTTVSANTFYVAVNGDDNQSGEESQPWKTIQKAADNLIAGDTVLVKEGIYNERVIVKNSGSIDQYIVFMNYQDDDVTLDGENISWGSSWNGLFDISQKEYIVISGFNIINADYGGIWVEDAQNIIIEKNYTYNTFSCGIGVWNSSFISVENNEVELACNDGEQECITISNTHHSVISKNHVHDNGPGTNGGEGIDIKQGSHHIKVYQNLVHNLHERIGIYADAWDVFTYNIEIYQNEVHHCGNGGITVQTERGGLLQNISIYNNIVYHNKWDGISVGSVTAGDDVEFTPVENVIIINNTCYKNGDYEGGWGFGILIDNPDAKNMIIRNNICSNNNSQIAIQQIEMGQTVDHNLIHGFNETEYSIYGSDFIIGDPLFKDPLIDFNFRLQENSPAIDKGSSVETPSDDFDENERPYNLIFDIGAYEYHGPSDLRSEKLENQEYILYPNPSQTYLVLKSLQNRAITNISVYTSTGKLLPHIIIQNKNIVTSTLPKGMYYVEFSHGGATHRKPFIVIK